MEENKVKYHSHRKPGVVFGFLLVLLGAVFLAFNFGVLDGVWKPVLFSWQMLLIVLGGISLVHRHPFNGLVLVVVGFFFVLPRLAVALPDVFGWAAVDFTRTYWPVLLMVAGVLILLSVLFRPQGYYLHHHSKLKQQGRSSHGRRRTGADMYSPFDRNSVFGSVSEIILDPVFTGGEMNAVFGNIMLDLRKTTIPEGETVIELNVVFGGVTIFVPAQWDVVLHQDCVFGGFGDSRMSSAEVDHSRRLVIYGSCVFGGGELKN